MQKKTIQQLAQEVLRHKELYYSGRAEISDEAYDKIEEELRSLDEENYALRVVGKRHFEFEKIKHETPMLSLEKTYEEKDLLKFLEKGEIISMVKYDGMSCSLLYKKGQLTLAKTRGDGEFGEAITDKSLWIVEIPKSCKTEEDFEVRGEIYCREENFLLLANEMEKLNLERPKSMRNIVAGLMGRKDFLFLSKFLSFVAFDFYAEKNYFKKEEEKLHSLKELGFEIPSFEKINSKEEGKKKIPFLLSEAQELMKEGDFLIDGLVFSYNSLELQEELGRTSHHPKFKLAFKFQGETAKTVIEKISYDVSRQGILTPVAEVKKVFLSGATIGRVTLHNAGIVVAHQLKVGDEIEIVRSGEVIPKFLSLVSSVKGEFSLPVECPSCKQEVELREIRLFCLNENCPARKREFLLNFIKRMEIDEISTKRLEEMMEKKLIKKPSDFFLLRKEDFLTLDKVKEKLAEKFFQSIQKRKKVRLATFFSSLSLTGGGYLTCGKVVEAGFDKIEMWESLTREDLIKIDSFAEKSAESFFLSLQERWPLVEDLLKAGVEIIPEKKRKSTFKGMKFCLTGSLSEKRAVIEERIKEHGGMISSSVTKETHYLVCNLESSSSSKYKKAQELKIAIIDEEKLKEMMQA